MPVISKIGARSAKVRFVYGLIYLVLVVGSITMVYPFLLMLAGSVKSEADAYRITPYPEFWFSDKVLFQKYAESKYDGYLDNCRRAWNSDVPNWRKVELPAAVPAEDLELYLEWRKILPVAWFLLGHTHTPGFLPKNARLYRQRMSERCRGDLDRFCRETGEMVSTWSAVLPLMEVVGRYVNPGMPPGERENYARFKKSLPAADLMITTAEGMFVRDFLVRKYSPDIAEYNKRHGTNYRSYRDISLPCRMPAGGLEREDWENFVRDEIFLGWVRLDESAAGAFRKFLAEKRYPGIEQFNRMHGVSYSGFDKVPFVPMLDSQPEMRLDWESFLKDRDACPAGAISVCGPSQMFEEFAAARRKSGARAPAPLGAVIAAADLSDCMADKRALRVEFSLRNYRHVLDYIALHGNGMFNTIVYCLLAILTTLLVNPMAAYALSRFNLPGTYKILLFCMATMAFPAEVTMIPSFILLKRFPLWPLLAGIAVTILVFLVLEKNVRSLAEKWRSLVALGSGLLAGAAIIPWFAPNLVSMSFLNTFAALVLPHMANGYFIFLLKGFFDSLPRELYEAAELDGAGEWCKFWTLTIRLSKPILAVIALGAFTQAYTAFLMALVIIPDPQMWTIMVWIYQLQSQSHQAVVYASLVLAAVPTFLIFAICQNIIIRGIVVPVEK